MTTMLFLCVIFYILSKIQDELILCADLIASFAKTNSTLSHISLYVNKTILSSINLSSIKQFYFFSSLKKN